MNSDTAPTNIEMTDSAFTFEAREATCPACGFHVAVPFLDSAPQPLATIAWPASREAAQAMERMPLDFLSCVDCGHVYNEAFAYAKVPYSDKPNLMFNRGKRWTSHLQAVQQDLARRLPPRPVIVEIGHGDGSFVAALAQLRPDGRYIGFDPHGCASSQASTVEFRAALFDPAVALRELQPDLIISRHVLEHLSNPLGFMQRIAFAAANCQIRPMLYIEVPCIDQAIASARTVDFYYEHNSQFTTESFNRMLARCEATVESIAQSYGGEVIHGLVRLGDRSAKLQWAQTAERFRTKTAEALDFIRDQVNSLAKDGQAVVIWGGTGKSAAFINRFGLDAARFPWVVDSDPAKVGTFVPGTGQEIRSPAWLLDHRADLLIIPPQWRARDILAEIEELGLPAPSILIEHAGKLVDFLRDDHPYV